MDLLTESAFASAERYIKTLGRKIDIAWFCREFENTDDGAGAAALSAYQCRNGGFGKRLEPDHRTMLPSCYSTSVAFGWFEKLGIPPSEEMLMKAVEYLRSQYIPESSRWPAIPAAANRDPHAIWWHFNEGESLCEAEKEWGLPSAEILGIMLKYDSGNSLWEECFSHAVARIDSISLAMDMNEASCFVRMTNYLEGQKLDLVTGKMTDVLSEIIVTDEHKWNEYSAKPLMYIQGPTSPFYQHFKDAVEKNLDWELTKQSKEGFWGPDWKWWRDEEFWPEAEIEWRSYLTVEKLFILNNFKRVDKM